MQQALQKDFVELPKIIGEIVQLVQRSIDKRGNLVLKVGVQLINEVKDLPVIEADAHKCTQVFYNIITNACKFTRKGQVTISSWLDPERKWVEIEVSDTGQGIATEAQERVFEPFEQENCSDSRSAEGIGLGLSIAREVVQRHGGRIYVKSQPGQGSTFTVRLPLSMSKQQGGSKPTEHEDFQGNAHKSHTSKSAEVSTPQGNAIILSVDDNLVNQHVVRGVLSDTYEVMTAMGGQEALDILQGPGPQPDVMLLDVMMPEMSGLEVCRFIREKLDIPTVKLPILMLSASAESDSVLEGFKAGCNDYLSKPFDKHVLKARVRSAVEIKRQACKQGSPRSFQKPRQQDVQDPDFHSVANDGLRHRASHA